MEYDAYVATIRSNIDRLGDAAEEAGLDAVVPSCPDWTVDDLTRHVGNINRFWTEHIVNRSVDPPDFSALGADAAPDGDDRFEWVRAGGQELADALAATPEDTPMWTFPGSGTARFWARRQAHEAVIHRCDAEMANGELGSIDTDLAADGVNEYFDIFKLVPAASAIKGNGETVHFHCTDRDVEWLVQLTPDGAEIRPEHAKGDVAVRGPANAIMLAVWNRIGPDNPELEIFGDRDLFDRWRRLTSF
jgi:uncharacterized protein (TIGR03083 family)